MGEGIDEVGLYEGWSEGDDEWEIVSDGEEEWEDLDLVHSLPDIILGRVPKTDWGVPFFTQPSAAHEFPPFSAAHLSGVDNLPVTPDPKSRKEMYLFKN